MPKLRLYTIFHLNLAYSSIEEEQRPEVVHRCYWPLLELATRLNIPIAVEASGYTLETINQIDSNWIAKLREAIRRGGCEFVGSGYAQTIGPLLPARVNAANLRLGNEVYERLLQVRPTIALVNEQAYSAGLLRHYLNAGYQAMVMEWNNPASAHKEWHRPWRYFPQNAVGQAGEEIAVIWNDSIAFQKFQRYAHKEMTLEQYLSFLDSQRGESERCFPLYGNDAEIFDFRPGRYLAEAELHGENEWHRIESLLMNLTRDERFEIILPSQTLAMLDSPDAGHKLRLESAAQPTPVKKQPKYNLTRWAVTGHGDFDINTACWQIYSTLRTDKQIADAVWRRLCQLWSSDYRTHITEPRWQKVLAELRAFQQELGLPADQVPLAGQGCNPGQDMAPAQTPVHSGLGSLSVRPEDSRERPDKGGNARNGPGQPRTDGWILVVETDRVRLHLNTRRGLAIDGLWFSSESGAPLLGTLPHGYYDDIALGADFYSGHVVFASAGAPKVTDLNPVVPDLEQGPEWLQIRATVETRLGPVHKTYLVYQSSPRVDIFIGLEWPILPVGSLRVGMVTINPAAFNRASLYYRTHNGGGAPETFSLTGKSFDHGQAVSALISAQTAVGLTEGTLELGDAHKGVRIVVDKRTAALIGMLSYTELDDTYFLRASFSAQEVDETSRRPAATFAGSPGRDFRFSVLSLKGLKLEA